MIKKNVNFSSPYFSETSIRGGGVVTTPMLGLGTKRQWIKLLFSDSMWGGARAPTLY